MPGNSDTDNRELEREFQDNLTLLNNDIVDILNANKDFSNKKKEIIQLLENERNRIINLIELVNEQAQVKYTAYLKKVEECLKIWMQSSLDFIQISNYLISHKLLERIDQDKFHELINESRPNSSTEEFKVSEDGEIVYPPGSNISDVQTSYVQTQPEETISAGTGGLTKSHNKSALNVMNLEKISYLSDFKRQPTIIPAAQRSSDITSESDTSLRDSQSSIVLQLSSTNMEKKKNIDNGVTYIMPTEDENKRKVEVKIVKQHRKVIDLTDKAFTQLQEIDYPKIGMMMALTIMDDFEENAKSVFVIRNTDEKKALWMHRALVFLMCDDNGNVLKPFEKHIETIKNFKLKDMQAKTNKLSLQSKNYSNWINEECFDCIEEFKQVRDELHNTMFKRTPAKGFLGFFNQDKVELNKDFIVTQGKDNTFAM